MSSKSRVDYRASVYLNSNRQSESNDVTAAQMNEWIEEARQIIWSRLISIDQGYGVVTLEQAIGSGIQTFELPTDMRQLNAFMRKETNYQYDLVFNWGMHGHPNASDRFSPETYTIQGEDLLIKTWSEFDGIYVYTRDIKEMGDYTDAEVAAIDDTKTQDTLPDQWLPIFAQKVVHYYPTMRLLERLHSEFAGVWMKDWDVVIKKTLISQAKRTAGPKYITRSNI